jgi:hypothetical protein
MLNSVTTKKDEKYIHSVDPVCFVMKISIIVILMLRYVRLSSVLKRSLGLIALNTLTGNLEVLRVGGSALKSWRITVVYRLRIVKTRSVWRPLRFMTTIIRQENFAAGYVIGVTLG